MRNTGEQQQRGVALLAVLSVLVILALLAASLAVIMQIESTSARVSVAENQLFLLLDSSLAHAKALVYMSHTATGEKDTTRDLLLEEFAPRTERGAPHWINVFDSRGALQGRYMLQVEDEAGKANLNSAFLTGPSQGSGWTPGEINLPLALGVPPKFAEALIGYRYGANRVPGARGDDDENNIFLMSDGIDNDADGVVDEDDEGVEDPGEYNAFAPQGDDRAFTGVTEALRVLRNSIGKMPVDMSVMLRREIPRRATLYSVDIPETTGQSEEDANDINVLTPRECRRKVGQANQLEPFGATQNQLNQLSVNIVDYRDQNYVLSTLGAQYGVEAVNFNEVLANDGTVAFNTAPATATTASVDDRDFVVPHYCMLNSHNASMDPALWRYATTENAAWDVEVVNQRQVKLLGPAVKFASGSGNYFMSGRRKAVFDHYQDMRRGSDYPPRTVRGENNGNVYNYDSFTWPDNFFRNASITLAQTKADQMTAQQENDPHAQKIVSSTRDGKLTLASSISIAPTVGVTRCVIWGWTGGSGGQSAVKRLPLMLTFQTLQPRKYYVPIVNNWSNHKMSSRVAKAGFSPYNKLDQDDRRPVNHKLTYGGDDTENYETVRASGRGNVDVFYSSGSDSVYDPDVLQYSGWNSAWGMTFMRPEVMELINVGPRAISLRGWTLTFNSGSVVNDVGILDYGRGYSLRASQPDPNPVIMPNGYFYLVNNLKLFNAEFGSGTPNANWGGNASQEVPVWEIPNDSWGVQYEIDKATDQIVNGAHDVRIHVRNEIFRPNQFRGEVVEAVNTLKPVEQKGCAHGCRYVVTENTRNTITIDYNANHDASAHFDPRGWEGSGAGVDRLMILGMPAKGGVVSMTIKNEYKQIVSRTVSYAYLDQEPDTWYGQSAEKTDPTQYNWVVRSKPSIGGQPRQAMNYAMRGRQQDPVFIKNGPLVSIGEVQRVRFGEEFKNVGASANKVGQRVMLSSLANVFDTANIRLEASDTHANCSGWKTAVGKVQLARSTSVTAQDGNWENNQWQDQTLMFLTGKLRGEKYFITGNSRDTVRLTDSGDTTIPRSAPNRLPLQPAKDDVFCLGPGYNSPLCYSRKSGEKGEWHWRNKINVPGTYQLYLFGLNDAISTTEFIEENYNAKLDVYVWNWNNSSYDQLGSNLQYGKDDSIHAGTITPAHISPAGDFKLQLVSSDVSARDTKEQIGKLRQAAVKRQTGNAWFNYAVITPVPVIGRINVNTASERLVRAMPGMDQTLAYNVANGVSAAHGVRVKPYQKIGDLLKVEGMTPAVFERLANLLTLQTTTYTIEAKVEVVLDANRDGLVEESKGDKVLASRHMRYVLRFNPALTGQDSMNVLERYAP